jgi:hypothetical protein
MASKANSIVSLKRPAGEQMAEEYWTEERRRSVAPIQLPVARAKLRGAAKAPASGGQLLVRVDSVAVRREARGLVHGRCDRAK